MVDALVYGCAGVSLSAVPGSVNSSFVRSIIYIDGEYRKGVADPPARLATAAFCAHSPLINGCHSNWKQQAAPRHIIYIKTREMWRSALFEYPRHSEINPPHCHFVHHKLHKDLGSNLGFWGQMLEVLPVLIMKNMVFLEATPCSLLEIYRTFRRNLLTVISKLITTDKTGHRVYYRVFTLRAPESESHHRMSQGMRQRCSDQRLVMKACLNFSLYFVKYSLCRKSFKSGV